LAITTKCGVLISIHGRSAAIDESARTVAAATARHAMDRGRAAV
jgi:hypothetical protein